MCGFLLVGRLVVLEPKVGLNRKLPSTTWVRALVLQKNSKILLCTFLEEKPILLNMFQEEKGVTEAETVGWHQ